eukprot:gnl/MRDRNA2_/MRDRNA2_66425_c0_seq1.p1 gnl/MRDRNA2_/MRDRNA2_66425_c0~~gnl/MRDRNA2_/MRDRNA2_66425_c0_seq1.p1  ORF type:complete len:121 (-),score=18.44 gnl/MRDRNA2_/MRDRNA2_66425_c0_seq1:16-378(-)
MTQRQVLIAAGSCCGTWRWGPGTACVIICLACVIAWMTASSRNRKWIGLRVMGFAAVLWALLTPAVPLLAAKLENQKIKVDHAHDVLDLLVEVYVKYGEKEIAIGIGALAVVIILAAALP